ncbi:MAG TPA: hypothetical protein VEZ46_10760, partial [Mycobacteriales bacterium]|nr:hypothetical protein [Mycobacteriales bacterium]
MAAAVVTVRQGGLVAVVLRVVLLPVGVGAAISEHMSAKAALEGALDNRARAQSQLLSDHFARARSIALLMSNNPSFNDVFELPGDRKTKITKGGRSVDRANEALAYLETLFPRSIGEVCPIDRTGAEAARVVEGDRAPYDDLSLEEASQPFFRPTFALDQGSVYQAAPYVSPDTDDWVVSSSTKLPVTGDTSKAIVHFEITVESFREAAATGSDVPVLVVDAATGAVIMDSRWPQAAGNIRGRHRCPGRAAGQPGRRPLPVAAARGRCRGAAARRGPTGVVPPVGPHPGQRERLVRRRAEPAAGRHAVRGCCLA